MPTDRMHEVVSMLPALGLGRVDVVAFQEVSCPAGITELRQGNGNDGWRIVAAKKPHEWRGRMVAVRHGLGKIVHKEVGDDALGVCIRTARGKIGILNIHLPPKATVAEAGARTAGWARVQAMRQTGRVIMGDFNETFCEVDTIREAGETLQHKTARGATILQWLAEQSMQAPNQEIHTPTYHPYNRLHQSRRLDYAFAADIEEGAQGGVHQLRHLVSSDHDAVTVCLRLQRARTEAVRKPQPSQHGVKQLKGEEAVTQLIQLSRRWKGDSLRNLQRAACSITEPKRNPFKCVESQDIKQTRARAMRLRHTPEARVLWKQVWKLKKQHKDQWHRQLLQEVLKNNWHALQAVKRSRKPNLWVGNLTGAEGWQKRMKQHFESIFKTQDGKMVSAQVHQVWKRLERKCKEQPWEPFRDEELVQAMANWKSGTSTGPDGVAQEALRALYQDKQWQQTILEEFNDALYKGRSPEMTKDSITVLLPKEPAPRAWSATRPITLSTS